MSSSSFWFRFSKQWSPATSSTSPLLRNSSTGASLSAAALLLVAYATAFVVPTAERTTSTPSSTSASSNNRLTTALADNNQKKFTSNKEFQQVLLPERCQASTHAIYGSLMNQTKAIQDYNVYRCLAAIPTIQHYQREWMQQQQQQQQQQQHYNATSSSTKERILIEPNLCVIQGCAQLGNALDGHVGTVHGGILALLMDDFLGHAYESVGVPLAVTANLNINYRAPVPANSRIQLRAYWTAWEGRKLYWTVQVLGDDDDGGDDDNNGAKVVYCEATCLYIVPRSTYETLLQTGFSSPQS